MCCGYLLLTLFMEQLAKIVQAASDCTFVSMRVLQVLIWDAGTLLKCALGLLHISLRLQYNTSIQICRC